MVWNSAESSVFGHRPQVCDPVLIFSGHILLCLQIRILLYTYDFHFCCDFYSPHTMFLHLSCALKDWASFLFLQACHFVIPDQFIIIFQLISLSTSWVGWLNLFGIIITCQPNILGYWWIWWSTIIWHCYSSLHISFNKMNSPVDFSLSELEWWAGYLSTYQFWQEVFKMPLWADRWSCTSFSVW